LGAAIRIASSSRGEVGDTRGTVGFGGGGSVDPEIVVECRRRKTMLCGREGIEEEKMFASGKKIVSRIAVVLAVVILTAGVAVAIEEPEYEIVDDHGDFEIRRYAPMILAETRVESDFEKAGNEAFRRLFAYISGDNAARAKIEMTAPVVQEASSEKIAMTAPVVQQSDDSGWRVAFVVPAEYSWETVPEPTDPRVSLRLVPERLVAAVRFSGTWGEERFTGHEDELRERLAKHGMRPIGEAVYARYNPPFTPWFMRRNEVMIPIALSGE
jgi:hypothetical protein